MKRALLSIASTIVSGLSNIVVQMVASGVLGIDEFARFSIVSATVIFGLGLGRAVIGQVDMLRGAVDTHRGVGDAALVCSVFFLAAGIVAMLVAGLCGFDTVSYVGLAVAISSVFVLQDAVRFRGFRLRKPGIAFLSDAVVLVLTVAGIFSLPPSLRGAVSLSLLWVGATFVGFVIGSLLLRYCIFSPKCGIQWVVYNRDLIIPGAGEFLLQAATPYALNFAVLAVGGAPALAGYRLVQLMFGALGNFAAGLNASLLPSLVDSGDPRKAQRNVIAEAAILTFMSAMLCLFMVAIPDDLGGAVFGDTWAATAPFLVVGAIHGWVNALAVPNFSLLRLLGKANFSFVVRLGSVVVTIIGAVVAGFVFHDSVGIAWAMALPSVAAYIVRLWASERELSTLVRSGSNI